MPRVLWQTNFNFFYIVELHLWLKLQLRTLSLQNFYLFIAFIFDQSQIFNQAITLLQLGIPVFDSLLLLCDHPFGFLDPFLDHFTFTSHRLEFFSHGVNMNLHLLLALDVLPTFTLQLSEVLFVFLMSWWYARKTFCAITDLLFFFLLWLLVLWLWRGVDHVQLFLKFGDSWVETLFKSRFLLNHWLSNLDLLIFPTVFENFEVVDFIVEAFTDDWIRFLIVCLHVHKNFNGIFNLIHDFEAVYLFVKLLLLQEYVLIIFINLLIRSNFYW